ncbi:MAG: HD domain-containing protein [Deltaproteobacteria bacterium]|nr:HD domain-containing protein [Deltaproteobacteria bacterium]MBW2591730.1 HD domain-containing protein [Deltaproteobacteria bacterium]
MTLLEASNKNPQPESQTIWQPDNVGLESPAGRIRKIAENLFGNTHGSHDWEHTLRVVRLCERIGSGEGADMQVLRIAAYLHDIGRCEQDSSNGTICHAHLGAQMARPLIKDLELTDERKNNIIHCIRSHRFRGDEKPCTLEAKVLFDADKIDAIGAVGVARAYLFAGELGARLHNPDVRVEDTLSYSREDTGYREFKLKLSKIRDRMLTEEGRRLAAGRHDFMNVFFQRFLDEHAGKC